VTLIGVKSKTKKKLRPSFYFSKNTKLREHPKAVNAKSAYETIKVDGLS